MTVNVIVVAGAVAGLLAYGLFQINWGLEGWQWVFLVEGVPSIFFGIVTYFYLPDFPRTAKFLSPEEREIVAGRLDDSVHSTEVNRAEFMATIRDHRTWIFCFLYVLVVNPLKAVTFFLPSLIESFHYTKMVSNLLTVPVYVFGAATTVGMAYHSDKRGERAMHVLVSCLVGGVGFAFLSFLPSLEQYELAYVFSFLVAGGTFPATILSLTWMTSSFSGTTRTATTSAMMVSCGNVGGFFSKGFLFAILFLVHFPSPFLFPFFIAPQIFGLIKSSTGSYGIALGLMTLAMFTGCFVVLIQRRILKSSWGFQQLGNGNEEEEEVSSPESGAIMLEDDSHLPSSKEEEV